ncbi:hypothetical protein JCM3765_004336 [Sporobolomyces pararoseus]
MDKFGGAFSQAKAYAEKGRTHVNAGLSKVDNQWQTRQRDRSGSNPSTPTSETVPAPPPPPPASRNRAPSTSTSAAGGISFSNLPLQEKQAFFNLLDEYFSTRPHLSHLFNNPTSNQEIENLSSFPRRGPLPTTTQAPPPPAPADATEWCTALYDYDSTDPGDLNFRQGDKIKLLEIVSQDWSRGELNNKIGIFPSNYAQKS